MVRLQKGVFHSQRPEASGMRSITHANRKSARVFDCDSVDANEVWAFVALLAQNGDGVCFSLTSDGGALTICVLSGQTRHKAYAATPEELYQRLTDLREELL